MAHQPRYKDQSLPINERVEDLLEQMNLDEKLAQLGCVWSTSLVKDAVFDPDYVLSCVPYGIGQITRIGASTGLRPNQSAAFMNAIQQVVLERTRLGIPIMVHEETVGGLCQRDATVFPQGIGLAATWDPALVERVGGVIREQMVAVGARLALAPVLDVARDPRWGRVEETYGEDPILSGIIGSAYVRGLQTNDLRQGVVATGKHFLGYAMSEGGRNWNPVHLGPRELREVYAEPFAAVIRESQLGAMMNSYTSLDGLPCAGSGAILNDLLRDELGFNGLVVADYFSVAQLYSFHRVTATKGEAAAMALRAGLDVELPASDCYAEPLKQHVISGQLPIEVIDTAVRRVLTMKFALGLFEHPYVAEEAAYDIFTAPHARATAYEAAAKSVILLKNNGILPIQPSVKTIAVVGQAAHDQRLLQGDYHYPAHLEIIYAEVGDNHVGSVGDGDVLPRSGGAYAPGPYYTPHTTPLAGLDQALGSSIELRYAKGCEVMGDDRSGFPEAVTLVQQADLAIVVVGGKSGLRRPATVGEANDATDLNLTGVQQELIEQLAKTGTPLVIVVLSGRVHSLTTIEPYAHALIQFFPPGECGGEALADVLRGVINPSGRLPVTMPRSVGQVPIHHGYRAGGDRPMFFDTYTDSVATPLYSFGHGLSYTSFEYANLEVHGSTTDAPIQIAVDITNTGTRAGDEVVQLYIRDDIASVARPDQLLLGFARITLEPGQRGRIQFYVHPSRLAFYDASMRFVVEPGSFTVTIGASASDLRLQQSLVLSGPTASYRQSQIVATRHQIELFAL